MSKQFALMAAAYADEEHAQTILDMLQQMHKASTIVLADSAMVTTRRLYFSNAEPRPFGPRVDAGVPF